jgi:hypothetical protein
MFTNSRRTNGVRLALGGAIAGVLAAGALAGPAMAASDTGSAAAAAGKANGAQHSLTVRKSGGDQMEFPFCRKAGGGGYIIAI